MKDDEIARQVETVVLAKIAADDLLLPTLPAVASKALALLGSENFSLPEVAALIETDPILAARLVRLANSATWGGLQRIDSILGCVSRIGATELRLFLVESAARQVLESRDARIAEICRGLWEHSLAVALLARDIVQKSAGEYPDGAYLAGLLHDVGKPVLAAMLLDAEQRLLGTRTRTWILPSTWLGLISRTHRTLGTALAARWGMPEVVSRSITDCADYDLSEPRSVSNAVRLANALAKRGGHYVGEADEQQIDSLLFVGLELFDLEPEVADGFCTTLAERLPARAG